MPFPPLRYWQRRHQHALAASGAADIENLIALHRHPPDIAMDQTFLLESKRKIGMLTHYA
jgi:hypothetical protein